MEARKDRAERWSSQSARQWMADSASSAGVYYADGHVRLYHGKLTALPRRYVARERLSCAAPLTIGLTPWTGARFLSSAGRSIPAC